MHDYRCKKCNKLLLKLKVGCIIKIEESVIETKCTRCGLINLLSISEFIRERCLPVDVIA